MTRERLDQNAAILPIFLSFRETGVTKNQNGSIQFPSQKLGLADHPGARHLFDMQDGRADLVIVTYKDHEYRVLYKTINGITEIYGKKHLMDLEREAK